MDRFAYFITPHGYGHAARAAAVMSAIAARLPGAVFDIYTQVPVWFFNMSLRVPFHYHDLMTDVGLAQSTSMEEDLPETIHRLEALLPFRAGLVDRLAGELRASGARLVLCDIAPLGIVAAHAAGLPSVLVENFTWDWIYAGYLSQEPRFAPYIDVLHQAFGSADHHIRTEPVCPGDLPYQLVTGVVYREPRSASADTRRRLGVPPGARLVMVTMGGILTAYPFLERLENAGETYFLVPGGSERYERRGCLVAVPHHSDIYHPDMVAASDAIVGKLGYSTLAEAYSAGLPFAYIPRPRFRESAPMGRFARQAIGALEVSEADFFSGAWLERLPALLAQPGRRPAAPNGAGQVAEYVLGL